MPVDGALGLGDLLVDAAWRPATNYDHVIAGRAHDRIFIALANGSNHVLGLDNVFIVTTLKQTGPTTSASWRAPKR